MKTTATCILVLAITLSNLFANDNLKQNIRGTVVDAITGYPLIGANVVLVNSDPIKGTVTDLNGNFSLMDIPVGRQSIIISYIIIQKYSYCVKISHFCFIFYPLGRGEK